MRGALSLAMSQSWDVWVVVPQVTILTLGWLAGTVELGLEAPQKGGQRGWALRGRIPGGVQLVALPPAIC